MLQITYKICLRILKAKKKVANWLELSETNDECGCGGSGFLFWFIYPILGTWEDKEEGKKVTLVTEKFFDNYQLYFTNN